MTPWRNPTDHTGPAPQTWTLATRGHCHICRTDTQQVEHHELLNARETVERRCQSCGQVTFRQHRPTWPTWHTQAA